MKKFDYICPCCNGKLSVPEEYLNNKCICPHCSEDFYIDQNDFLCVEKAIKKENNTHHFHCPFCTKEILIFEYDFAEGYVQCPICEMTIILNGEKQNSKNNCSSKTFQHCPPPTTSFNEKKSKKTNLSTATKPYTSKNHIKNSNFSKKCECCSGKGRIEINGRKKICHACNGKGFVSILNDQINATNQTPPISSNTTSNGCLNWILLAIALFLIVAVVESCDDNSSTSIYDIPRDKPISPDQFSHKEWTLIIKRAMEETPEYQYYKKRGY